MADCATRLTEAKDALHALKTGRAVVEVTYNGVSTKYTQANIKQLRSYIADLEAECGESTSVVRRGAIMFRG